MLGSLLGGLLKQLIQMILKPDGTGVDTALQALFTMPIPDLSSPEFKRMFAITWAIGIITGLLCGFVVAVAVLGYERGRLDSVMPIAGRLTYFMRVFVVGFFAVPVTALLLYLATKVTQAVNLLAMFKIEPSKFDQALTVAGSLLTPKTTFAINEISWAASVLLTITITVVTYMVVPVLLLTPIMYGISAIPVAGENIWRFWVSVLLVTLCSKPIVAWCLGVGNAYLSWQSSLPGFQSLGGWKTLPQIALVIAAAFIPAILLVLSIVFVSPRVRTAASEIWGRVSSDITGGSLSTESVDPRIELLQSIMGGGDASLPPVSHDDNPAASSRQAAAELLHEFSAATAVIHPAAPIGAELLSSALRQEPAPTDQSQSPPVSVEIVSTESTEPNSRNIESSVLVKEQERGPYDGHI